MRAADYLIVRSKKAYNNTKGGLISNSSVEDVSSINREVEVHKVPKGVVLEEGDKVIIHHNILRFRNNMKGNIVNSNYYLGVEGEYILYFVPLTEIFMYKREGLDWTPLEPFCFVKPIGAEDSSGVILTEEDSFDHKGNVRHQGILTYINKDQVKQGLKVGDRVVFSTWGEYEFEINGEILYKMSAQHILIKI
jgi:co-chaperonin GroES (HSP10)